MRADVAAALAERFFLDLIGSIVPGGFLIWSLSAVFGTEFTIGAIALAPGSTSFSWMAFLGASYVVGHILVSVNERVTNKPVTWLCRLKSRDETVLGIAKSESFKRFIRNVRGLQKEIEHPEVRQIRDRRSEAMSIAAEEKPTVYRFQFLSLLNGGVATAALLVIAAWLFGNLLRWVFAILPGLEPLSWWLVLTPAIWFLLDREQYFYRVTQAVPFSMANAKLPLTEKTNARDKHLKFSNSSVNFGREQSFSVYLAGGFRSGWQEHVVEACAQIKIRFFDPRSHNLDEPTEYSVWDLLAIRNADVVFAYLEEKNPGGYALALEIGYAKALGKLIVFVDEKSGRNEAARRYLEMLHACSDASFASFEDGVRFLRSLRPVNGEDDVR